MKITIAHNRSKAEVIQTIDRSFDEMSRPNAGLPVQLAVKSKSWQGAGLNFELSAKMAMLSTPISGSVAVKVIVEWREWERRKEKMERGERAEPGAGKKGGPGRDRPAETESGFL